MTNDTQTEANDESLVDEPVRTSGHVERTVLHHMVGDGEPYEPTTVGAVLDDVVAVIERGDYGNVGPRSGGKKLVQQSTLRRTFGQLHDKGLIRRVEGLSPDEIASDRYDLGELSDGEDPDDPTAYSKTSDDARVADWILAADGRTEIDRLDARYGAELDELAAQYGRPRGETTRRIEV